MVIISDEYMYILWEAYVLRNLPHAQLKYRASYIVSLFIKNANLQRALENLTY